ncbi:MAG: DUF3617 domain-containing protein, partial [Steroidobacteraceae bacterium]
MPVRQVRAAATLLVLGAVSVATQAEDMKAGLWEYKSKMSSASGEMEAAIAEAREALASMPPEQRRMMEQMMAARGMQMSMGADTTQVIRVCVTEEQARDFDVQSDPNCTQQTVDRSGNRIKVRFACKSDGVITEGEGELVFTGGSSYQGTTTIRTNDNGKRETLTVQQEGRRLGDDCGNLKPRR